MVVKGFLQGSLLQEHRSELEAYIADVVRLASVTATNGMNLSKHSHCHRRKLPSQIPTKNTDEHFFDGRWSAEGLRGPVTALKSVLASYLLQWRA